MYEYNPATVPGLPAGWEINLYESGEYIVLALWRAIAYLKDFKEDRGDDPLNYSYGRYADAYLPVGYTQEDFDEALQELVWKAQQFDNAEDEIADYWSWLPKGTDRPTRSEYFRRLEPWR